MITGLVVLKMVLTPSSTRLASAWNSGPRWSMMGVSIARRTRSGSGDGPGICRKWRPTGRDEFLVMFGPWGGAFGLIADRRGEYGCGGPRLAAMNSECETQSRLLADMAELRLRDAVHA